MIAYLDTSSLFKLYHSEEDSERLSEILAKKDYLIYLSGIARIEFVSAIWKRIRNKELKQEIGEGIIACFETDSENFCWVELKKELVIESARLIKKYGKNGLRTLDSFQLACALTLIDEDCHYFTSDKILKKLFKEEKLMVVDY